MAKDDLNKRKEQLQAEYNLNEAILKQAKTHKALSNEGISLRDQLLDRLKGEKDLGTQITSINEAIEGMLQEQIERGDEVNQHYIDQLDRLKEILEKEKERKDVTDELKGIGQDFAKDLGNTLGVSNQLVDALLAGGAAAIGFAIMKEVLGYITDSVGRIKELRGEFGTTAGQAMELNSELSAAKFSLEGMILGGDKLEAGMKAIVSETGNFKLATSEMITNVAELSEMMDSGMAVSLSRSLKNNGQDTAELTEYARELSEEIGVSGAEGMKYLASNQLELTGLTKKQIKERIKEGMVLKKMGADMDHLNDLASEALDIEKSLKDEMKLRAMTGKDINLNDLRAAQASGDRLAIAQAEKRLVDQLGPELQNNLQIQRIIGEATGLSKEQMLNYKNATAEAASEAETLAGNADASSSFMASLGGYGLEFLKIIGLIAGAMLALSLVSKGMKAITGSDSNPIADFVSKFGTKEVLFGAASMLLVASSVFVFGKAIQEFIAVEWGALGKAVVAMLALVGAVALLGVIMSSGMIGPVLAGAAAMLIVAAAMYVLGKAIQEIAIGIGLFGENIGTFVQSLGSVVETGPQLLAAGVILGAFGVLLLPFAAALLIAGPALVIFGLGLSMVSVVLPIVTELLPLLMTSIGQLVVYAPMLLVAAAGLLAFGVSLLPLSFALLIATPAILLFSVAMLALGVGLSLITGSIDRVGEQIPMLVEQVPQLIGALSLFAGILPILLAFGIALLPFAAALLIAGPAMLLFGLGLSMVGTFLPIVAELLPILMENLIQLAVYAPMLLLASAGLLAFGLSLLPLSFALILATPAILLFSIAMLALGVGLSLITGSIDRIGEQIPMLVDQIPQLVDAFSGFVGILPALLLIGPALLAFGFSLLPLSFSLLLATPIIAVFGAAMMLLGTGLDITSKSMAAMGESMDIFIESMMKLSIISPMLVALTPILALFGLALIPLAIGMSMIAIPMIIFALSLDILAKSLPPMVMMLPLFVASLVTMAEQIPSIIGLAASFMLLTTSMIALATTMVVFTPIFAFGTLVTAALVPAMLFAAFGTGLWAASVQFLSTSFESLIPNLMAFLTAIPMMGMLVTLIPGLVALSGAFFLLSTSLFSLGAGLGFIGLFLPVLAALGILLPTVSAAFGGDEGESAKDNSQSSGPSMKEVVSELKALRQDIQQQPIVIKVDGKVVSEITKVQLRKESVRNNAYGR